MVIRFFRSSFVVHYIVYILIGIVLWLNAFISPPPVVAPASQFTPVYQVLYDMLVNIPLLATVIAFFIVIIEGIMLNMVLSEHDMSPRNTFLPGILYLVFMSANPEGLTLYPALVSSILFIPMVHILYGLYLKEDTLKQYLSAGMLTGVSFMIYIQSILFMPVIFMSMVIFRNSDWRSWASSVIGFIIPFLYLFTYYFWIDSLGEAMNGWADYFGGFFHFDLSGDVFLLSIFGGITLFFALPAIARTIIRMSTHRIALRRLLSLTIWIWIFLAVMVFTRGDNYLHTLVWLPSVALVAQSISGMRKYYLQEFLFMLLILSVAYHNFVH